MLDTPEVLIIVLTALTVVVWTHSWIMERREDSRKQPAEVEVEEEMAEELVA
jgi:hypothetical protein